MRRGARESVLACAVSLFLLACSRAPEPVACGSLERAALDGFGEPGSHRVMLHKETHPRFPDLQITTRRPDTGAPAPVVIFVHANGLPDDAAYAGLLDHLASRGSVVLHAPYPTEHDDHGLRTDAIWEGVINAIGSHAKQLDLTRIGLVGHSYGAGALPWLAHKTLVESGLGTEGAFLVSLAPWFSVRTSERSLSELPAHLQSLVVTFDADDVNDPGIAIDTFEALPGPAKAFWELHSVDRDDCVLTADHAVPQSAGLPGLGGVDDAFDDGLRRLLDAIAASAFEADAAGRALALRDEPTWQLGTAGDGSAVEPLQRVAKPERFAGSSPYLFRIEDRERWLRFGGEPAPDVPR